MKYAAAILFLLFIFSCNASAGNASTGMKVYFSDVFPMCAQDSSHNASAIRCAAEFIVPNLHIGAITNMLLKFIGGIFKLLVDTVGGVLNPWNWIDFIRRALFPDYTKVGNGEGEGIVDASTQLLSDVAWTLFGLITPIVVIFMIIVYEMIKSYLVFAVPACLFMNVFDRAGEVADSNGAKVFLVVLVAVGMIVGTIYMAGIDLNTWKLFINFG